jgi:hypothetical protein
MGQGGFVCSAYMNKAYKLIFDMHPGLRTTSFKYLKSEILDIIVNEWQCYIKSLVLQGLDFPVYRQHLTERNLSS